MNELGDAAKIRVFPPAIPLVTVLAGVGAEYLVPIQFGATPSATLRLTLGALIAVGAVLGLGLWSVLLVRRSGQKRKPLETHHRDHPTGAVSVLSQSDVLADGPGVRGVLDRALERVDSPTHTRMRRDFLEAGHRSRGGIPRAQVR